MPVGRPVTIRRLPSIAAVAPAGRRRGQVDAHPRGHRAGVIVTAVVAAAAGRAVPESDGTRRIACASGHRRRLHACHLSARLFACPGFASAAVAIIMLARQVLAVLVSAC